MERHYFKPAEIPKQITVPLFLTYGVGKCNLGRMSVTDYFNEDSVAKSRYDREYRTVLLSKFEVTIDIPEGVDLSKKYRQVLNNEKRRIQQRHFVELKVIQDQIDSLNQIEYKPTGAI